jgi:2-polyprenyl-3-methyl-5-hydroxy-6-metoxy-1,4-benzoquinol methylase
MTSWSRSSTTALAFLAGTTLGCVIGWLATRLSPSKGQKPPQTPAEHYLWQIVQHSFTGALIHAGDQLQLYDVLDRLGPVTAQQLAHETGWSQRWLTEFLAQATSAGLCVYQAPPHDTFQLRPEYAALLCDPDTNERSMAGMFQFLLPLLNRSTAVVTAIQTGVGVDYDWAVDDAGNVNMAIDRKNRNWFYHHLVEDLIATVSVPSTGERVVDMLDRGVNAADIGCGCGASTMTMAKRFPKSHFYAYETSKQSMQVLLERMQTNGTTNITVCDAAERSIAAGPDGDNSFFSFVYSHDVLHDMTHPKAIIQDIKEQLSEEGCWIIVDVDCDEKLGKNVEKPTAALLYGFSCLLCLASATSSPTGQGLGTYGLSEKLLRQWTHEAGFKHMERRRIESLRLNSCFVVA